MSDEEPKISVREVVRLTLPFITLDTLRLTSAVYFGYVWAEAVDGEAHAWEFAIAMMGFLIIQIAAFGYTTRHRDK